MADACPIYNPVCILSQTVADGVTNGGISALSNATGTAYGKIAGAFANAWMIVPDPQVTTSGTNSAAVSQYGQDIGASTSTTSSALSTILGYATWTAMMIAVLSIAALGIGLFIRRRSSTGEELMVRWIPVFAAVGLIAAAGSIGSAIGQPIVNGSQSTAIYFLQANTAWFTVALVVISIIITAIVMLVRHRAEPMRELATGIAKMAFVSAAGTLVASLVMQGFDSWAWSVMNAASNCESGPTQASCFGKSVEGLLALASTSGIGDLAVIVLGIVAIIILTAQIALFLIRSALLPLLIGLLPLGYAAALIPGGKKMSRSITGWVIAFVLYKPAAALIYSFVMVQSGSVVGNLDVTGLFNMVYGLILVLAAAIALPALIRLCVPAVEAVASGMGAATLLGLAAGGGAEGLGQLASGAIRRGASDGGGAASSPSGASSAGGGAASGGAASGGAAGGGAGAGAAAGGGGAGAAAGGGAAAAGAAVPVAGVALMAAEKGKEVAQGAVQAVSSAIDSAASGAQPSSGTAS